MNSATLDLVRLDFGDSTVRFTALADGMVGIVVRSDSTSLEKVLTDSAADSLAIALLTRKRFELSAVHHLPTEQQKKRILELLRTELVLEPSQAG